MIHDCKNCPKSGNCDLENPLKEARAIKNAVGAKGLAEWVIGSYEQGPEEMFSRLQFSVMAIEADPDMLQSFRVQVNGWGGHEMPKHVQEALPKMFQAASHSMTMTVMQAALYRAVAVADALDAKLMITKLEVDKEEFDHLPPAHGLH